jgi:uncharacterized protein
VPAVSGISAKKLHPAKELAELEREIYLERIARVRGEPARTMTLFGSGERGKVSMFQRQKGMEQVLKLMDGLKSFRNEITVATLDCWFEMEVRAYAERIAPPVLMLLAASDTVAPVAEARHMFERTESPSRRSNTPVACRRSDARRSRSWHASSARKQRRVLT